MTRNRQVRARRWGALPLLAAVGVVLAAGTAVPAPATAQGVCDEQAGTLGIQGLRCEGCSYSMSESGIEEARFRTEPQVMVVARGSTRGDRLRAGDRIVAIDDALITTREGGERLVALRAGQRLTLRVRRGGRLVDLDLVAGSACELRRRLEEEEVEVERMEGMEGGWAVVSVAPPAPPAAPRRVTLPALPALPAVPEPPAPPSAAWLGFGIRCSDCGMRDGVFFFSAPPEITGVADDGPAAAAGLRSGDRLVAVAGEPITGAGARRFSEVEPGQSVALTVERAGDRQAVTVTAEERATRVSPAPMAPVPISDRVRFEGRIGDALIEVRGAPVRVTRDEATGELIIRTAGNVIRIRQDG